VLVSDGRFDRSLTGDPGPSFTCQRNRAWNALLAKMLIAPLCAP